MAIQIMGQGAVVAEVDGSTFRAVRVTPRPVDYGSRGAYAYGGFTGILPAALGANSEIFQFRWADATRLAVIRKIRIAAAVTTTFFIAGVPVQIDLVKATSWTGAGSGGSSPSFAALLKRRSDMANSLVANGDIRIASTAALGAGTKTLEGLSLSTLLAPGPTASPGVIFAPGTILWQAEVGDGENPLVLVQNEGFVIRSVAVPGTGTWQAAITIDWAEVLAY